MTTEKEPQAGAAGDEATLRCSIPEAARRLGISERSVRRKIEKGTLVMERDGLQWVVLIPISMLPAEPTPRQDDSARITQQLAPPIEPPQARPQDRIAKAIERLDARHTTRLRMLSGQLHRHANAGESDPEGSPEAPAIHPGPWERELETPAGDLSAAAAQQDQATAEQAAIASPPPASPPPDLSTPAAEPTQVAPDEDQATAEQAAIASPPPDPSALPAEPAQAAPAEPNTLSEQQWEALFSKASNSPASTTTPAIPPQSARLADERQTSAMPFAPHMGWRERLDWWWQDLISRYAYRSRLIVTMLIIIVIVGVLLGAAILLLLNSPSPGGATEARLAATDPAAQAAATSAVQSQPASSPAPAAPTAASQAAAPAVPTAAQPAAQPTAAATDIPSARATAPALAPTAPAPTSTNTPAPAVAMLQRVAAAEAAVRSGEFEATIENQNNTGAQARLRFDVGDATRPPAFHITSIYTGTAGVQTVERITVGDRSWERQPDGRWSARSAHEGVMDQMQVFLPRAEWIDNATLDDADPNVLRWHDAARDTDVTLVVDPASGIPKELRRVTRATGTMQIVSYRQWNTAVDIVAPTEG